MLFVANGHGETAIAARIGVEIAGSAKLVALDLLPLVGAGLGAAPLTAVGPRRAMPSGGLVAMGNVRAFARDLRAGFAGLFARQLTFLRGRARDYDVVVAVGDVYALGLALLAGRPTVFVGTAKSVYVAPYGAFERLVLRRARRAFVRDVPTAERLRRQGVRAEAPGNVIVDMVPAGSPPAGEWIGILPGSRDEAYADGVRLARVVRALGTERPALGALLSIAATVEAARFAECLAADGWAVQSGTGRESFRASAGTTQLRAWRGPLGALFAASVVVLGQAGTANEQAAAVGVPVVALESPGSRREDWYRMRQRRLLGDALLVAPAETERAAAVIANLLQDQSRLQFMRRAGPERLGKAGGAVAIARAILETAA